MFDLFSLAFEDVFVKKYKTGVVFQLQLIKYLNILFS